MDTQSVWRGTAAPTAFAPLQGDTRCEVLIVGGGITGVTLALLLARQGRQVLLLEAHEIGSGSTGHSTGNLYRTLSQGMQPVVSRWGEDVARQVASERGRAMAFIEQEAMHMPEAEFRHCALYLYARTPELQDPVDQEFEALAKAGLTVERQRSAPDGLPPAAGDVLALPDQAQFHPQAYVAQLARLAAEAGARIHEHTPVLDVDSKARRVVTAAGAVDATELVMATHTPKGIRLVHAEMPVHREYGIAFESPQLDPGPGIFWCRGEQVRSVRTLKSGGRNFLLCIGPDHHAGHHNSKAALMALEQEAVQLFGQAPVAFRWSAQNYQGADQLPYIGPDSSGCYVATGFASDGLTWGTVAAHLLAEQIAGRSPALSELLKPTRLSPIKGGRTILQESVTVVKHLVQDYLTHRQEEKLASLAPGDSAVIESDGDSFAAWRSPEGELYAVSPVCTHMGCKVHWNSVETSWDCPCHGSRFRPDGTVLEGPALAPLERKRIQLRSGGETPPADQRPSGDA
jgi:glycine/D-amino acid oxidase-like deaminating enzyme/nitrite reductase/ring-hydroxylating ferredoxin subunit